MLCTLSLSNKYIKKILYEIEMIRCYILQAFNEASLNFNLAILFLGFTVVHNVGG